METKFEIYWCDFIFQGDKLIIEYRKGHLQQTYKFKI